MRSVRKPLQLPDEGCRGPTNRESGWDSYSELSAMLINRAPFNRFAAVLVIDESTRRGLGKSNMLTLLRKLQSMRYPLNCYIDIVPTGSSDIEIIRIVDSYKSIPVYLVTSDKALNDKLKSKAILVKSKGTNEAVRIVFNTIKRRISRL